MDAPQRRLDQALRALVDEYRDRCLWYLRRDYYPATVEEALGVLDAIQKLGDRDAFRRAAEIHLSWRWWGGSNHAT